MNKRIWHYIYNPKVYEMCCDKCHGQNIEWSEFEGKIWCYDCEIDTDGFGGIFSGPIPHNVTELILGKDCFNRWNMMVEEREEFCKLIDGKIEYFSVEK